MGYRQKRDPRGSGESAAGLPLAQACGGAEVVTRRDTGIDPSDMAACVE